MEKIEQCEASGHFGGWKGIIVNIQNKTIQLNNGVIAPIERKHVPTIELLIEETLNKLVDQRDTAISRLTQTEERRVPIQDGYKIQTMPSPNLLIKMKKQLEDSERDLEFLKKFNVGSLVIDAPKTSATDKLAELKTEWLELNMEYKEIYTDGSTFGEGILVDKIEKIEETFRQLGLDVITY